MEMNRWLFASVFAACSSASSQTADAGPAIYHPEPLADPPTTASPAPCLRREYFVFNGSRYYVTLPCNPAPVTRDLGDPLP